MLTKCALYNFHGHYYTDSDLLDDILHFRVIPLKLPRAEATAEMEAMMKNPMIAAMMPNTRSMKENLEKISRHKEMEPPGSGGIIREDWIHAFSDPEKNSSRLKVWRKDMNFTIPRRIRFIWITAMMRGKALGRAAGSDIRRSGAVQRL